MPALAPRIFTNSPVDARRADATALATLLRAVRADTLALFADYEHALPSLVVPQSAALNPPLWELGHLGWFQEFWTTRNTAWRDGARADPCAPRSAPLLAAADALYDSSRVPHAPRWSLPLPDAGQTRALLSRQLKQTLQLLGEAPPDDDSLYFFRLVLLHEAMHIEAAIYMAQALGIAVREQFDGRQRDDGATVRARTDLPIEATHCTLGSSAGGFAFDNELEAHAMALPAYRIDAAPVRWREFLPFVEAHGYTDARWWTAAGQAWLRQSAQRGPRYVRSAQPGSNGWEQQRFGRWQPLDLDAPVCHLTCHEAEAWCRWAGRRLPTEAEWEFAAVSLQTAFEWGSVWEWTSSTFAPYRGFAAHPYRDYSQPWFGTRRVLRGASYVTRAVMRSPRYRNFFEPERNDIHAGFRSCALD